jgi:hypothetical protein
VKSWLVWKKEEEKEEEEEEEEQLEFGVKFLRGR